MSYLFSNVQYKAKTKGTHSQQSWYPTLFWRATKMYKVDLDLVGFEYVITNFALKNNKNDENVLLFYVMFVLKYSRQVFH